MSKIFEFINKNVFACLGVRVNRVHESPVFLFHQDAVRFLYFARRFNEVRHLEGDIVECGVSRGKSLLMLSYLANSCEKDRYVWGYDTFEGLPPPSREDDIDRLVEGQFAAVKQVVHDMLLRSDIGEEYVRDRILLVEGLVQETLPRHKGGPIALLHLDVDLYEGYLSSLQILYDSVVPGGVIMFDEYANVKEEWPGAKRAIDEFFEGEIEKIKYDSVAKKYYFVKP
jgi:hypothetical protein|tara:strand:+ start:1661 stop:2341 length:681 start_codon:yes stop_codon:yes gene_type:complete